MREENSSFKMPDFYDELLSNSIFISGLPRSGTTLLGKIVGSLSNLEYHFEPPCFYLILSLYASSFLSFEQAKIIISLILSEELLLESAHGRSINLRPNDDSQILHRMNWSELNKRWNSIKNRHDAINFCNENRLRLCVKTPCIFDSINLIRKTVKNPFFLIIIRNGFDVVNSILNKEWLSKEGLSRDLWPYVNNDSSVNIPYWVTNEYRERWPNMTPLLRTVVMWNIHAGIYNSLEYKKDFIEIRYEDLVNNPYPLIDDLANKLGVNKTFFTKRWIESIKNNQKNYNKNKMLELINKEDPDIASKFLQLNKIWDY